MYTFLTIRKVPICSICFATSRALHKEVLHQKCRMLQAQPAAHITPQCQVSERFNSVTSY